jgi:hypothetical protein
MCVDVTTAGAKQNKTATDKQCSVGDGVAVLRSTGETRDEGMANEEIGGKRLTL